MFAAYLSFFMRYPFTCSNSKQATILVFELPRAPFYLSEFLARISSEIQLANIQLQISGSLYAKRPIFLGRSRSPDWHVYTLQSDHVPALHKINIDYPSSCVYALAFFLFHPISHRPWISVFQEFSFLFMDISPHISCRVVALSCYTNRILKVSFKFEYKSANLRGV